MLLKTQFLNWLAAETSGKHGRKTEIPSDDETEWLQLNGNEETKLFYQDAIHNYLISIESVFPPRGKKTYCG